MDSDRVVIRSKKDLMEYLNYELPHYKSSKIRCLFPITENDVLAKHQILLRKTEYYVNCQRKLRAFIYKIRLYRMQNRYSINIPINTCGKGLRIMHLGSVLINGNAKIGENCAFHINTALVASGPTNDAPILNNGVVVGVGAVIVGKVEIAQNVAIGANAVVNKSVYDENVAIAGVPAKIVSKNGRLNWNRKKEL